MPEFTYLYIGQKLYNYEYEKEPLSGGGVFIMYMKGRLLLCI